MSLRDLRRHVGQLAIVGFSGHAVPADLKRVAAQFDLGGVIYFARNIAEPAQVAELSQGVTVRILRLETLLRMKADAGRPQDLADVAELCRIHGLGVEGLGVEDA